MFESMAQGVHGLLEDLELDPLVHDVLGTLMIVMTGLIAWSAMAVLYRVIAPASDGAAVVEDRTQARNPHAGEQPKLETTLTEHRGLRAGSPVRVELPRHVADGVVESIVERRFVGVVFCVTINDTDGRPGETFEVPDTRVHGAETHAVERAPHPEVDESAVPASTSERVGEIRDVQQEIAENARRQRERQRLESLS